MISCRCYVALGISLSIAGAAGAGDWTQFRGPAGDGHSPEKNLPIEWGPAKNVAWKQPIPGSGWSSPIWRDGRLYLTSAVPVAGSASGDLSLRTLCLDAKTGKPIWSVEVFGQDGKAAPRIHGKNSHASPTPLLLDGKIFVHFGHQGTACLDLAGKVVWRNRKLSYQPVHGNGGSPIAVDDLLIFSCDGGDQRFVVALDRASGAIRWKTDRTWNADRKFSFSTPVAIEVDGHKQIVSAASDGVVSYDAVDGKEIWRVHYDGYSVIPKPVVGHGMVFVCTGYNQPALLAIRTDGRGDVTTSHVAWKTKKAMPHTPSPLLVGDELYTVSDGGVATCLDAKTGKEHWQQRLGGNYSASPIYAAGRLYFQSEDGVGTVVKAGKTFEVLAKNPLNERTLASYAAADGALFVRTEKNLYRFQSR